MGSGQDKGDVGAQAQLSPLLNAISALDTAADQIIYLTGKDSPATTALTELGRKLIAATNAETAREEIGAAADSDVLKIDNNLSEISTADSKMAVISNLGISDVITESNSTFRKNSTIVNGDCVWTFNKLGQLVVGDNNIVPGRGTSAFYTTLNEFHLWGGWKDSSVGTTYSIPNAEKGAATLWKAAKFGVEWIAGASVFLSGDSAPGATYAIHVANNDFYFNAQGGLIISGTMTCSNLVQTSDLNKKHDIEDIENPDEIIMSWSGKTFKLNSNDQLSAGILAQDVVKKFPEAVTVLPDGSLGVDYSALQAPMIESMKNRINNEAAMLKRIEELEARLDALSNNS